jgi:hypothetical protein
MNAAKSKATSKAPASKAKAGGRYEFNGNLRSGRSKQRAYEFNASVKSNVKHARPASPDGR